MKMLIAAAAVLTAGLALPASAAADYGYTSARTSMRYGPSVEYQRITIIPRRQRVYVRRCTPRYVWCEVQYRRRSGWVSANHLMHERYRRPYNRLGFQLSLPLFDFYAHIGDFDQDRRKRYRRYRHNDTYYHNQKRRSQWEHRRHQQQRQERGVQGRTDNRKDGRDERRTRDRKDDRKDDDRKRRGENRPR
jgi:uncharacterized protein YraI